MRKTLRLVRLPVKELIMLEMVTVDKLPFRKAVNGCNSYSMLYHDVNAANVSLAILLAWVFSAICALLFFYSSILYQYVYYVCKRKKSVKIYVCEFLVSDLRGQIFSAFPQCYRCRKG